LVGGRTIVLETRFAVTHEAVGLQAVDNALGGAGYFSGGVNIVYANMPIALSGVRI
jgi:hypothetical protein